MTPGRTIVVTRAEEQADGFLDGLRARGATPLLVPAIRFEPADPAPLARAARSLDGAAWVVFTSATGVAFGWTAIRAAGGLPDGVRVAAVGSGTADALRQRGAPVDFVPDQFVGDALVRDLPLAPGDRVVLLRSHIGREAIATGLADRGAEVDDVTAYRTVVGADPDAVADALAQSPDAVAFTSPSTARGFLDAADPGALAGVALVAIGPVTAAALAPFGLTPTAVAEPHTVPGLLDTLGHLFAADATPHPVPLPEGEGTP
ncbi:uroporphyrinogen-III synthase [Rubrivirga sp. IMCC45206]|uniref:uroporphyrinogen-III synthase n=1 Tax=Rubrivirga sp. IMCC45206 TaxID=3391614 RepID=UPI00398FD9FF